MILQRPSGASNCWNPLPVDLKELHAKFGRPAFESDFFDRRT
jgi:hypothetical protein